MPPRSRNSLVCEQHQFLRTKAGGFFGCVSRFSPHFLLPFFGFAGAAPCSGIGLAAGAAGATSCSGVGLAARVLLDLLGLPLAQALAWLLALLLAL